MHSSRLYLRWGWIIADITWLQHSVWAHGRVCQSLPGEDDTHTHWTDKNRRHSCFGRSISKLHIQLGKLHQSCLFLLSIITNNSFKKSVYIKMQTEQPSAGFTPPSCTCQSGQNCVFSVSPHNTPQPRLIRATQTQFVHSTTSLSDSPMSCVTGFREGQSMAPSELAWMKWRS